MVVKHDVTGKLTKTGDTVKITGKVKENADEVAFFLFDGQNPRFTMRIYFDPTELHVQRPQGLSSLDDSFHAGDDFTLLITRGSTHFNFTWQGKKYETSWPIPETEIIGLNIADNDLENLNVSFDN